MDIYKGISFYKDNVDMYMLYVDIMDMYMLYVDIMDMYMLYVKYRYVVICKGCG